MLPSIRAREDEHPGIAAPEQTSSPEVEIPAKKRPVRCRRCSAIVTHEESRIEVAGTHEHLNANPVGVAYLFGCFRDAVGCEIGGEPITAHTWFPGCAWQFALCGGCSTHLGWYFTGSDTFFGLILDRLVGDQ